MAQSEVRRLALHGAPSLKSEAFFTFFVLQDQHLLLGGPRADSELDEALQDFHVSE